MADSSMTIRWISGDDSREDAFSVRREVFCREQGYEEVEEFDAIDREAQHVVVYENGQPTATGRLYRTEEPGAWRIGRVAVRKSHRGMGLGAVIMEQMLKRAGQLKAEKLELDAQCRAMGFYQKFGFEAVGDEHMDGTIPHKKMQRILK